MIIMCNQDGSQEKKTFGQKMKSVATSMPVKIIGGILAFVAQGALFFFIGQKFEARKGCDCAVVSETPIEEYTAE